MYMWDAVTRAYIYRLRATVAIPMTSPMTLNHNPSGPTTEVWDIWIQKDIVSGRRIHMASA